jgi:hypothetical protein
MEKEVFLTQIKGSYLKDSTIITITDTIYYTISDGYLIVTNLESDSSISINNPFSEYRLAKSFPNNGDICYFINSSDYFVAEESENPNHLLGNFGNVFSFKFYIEGEGSLGRSYYCENIGYIGTGKNDEEMSQLSTYKFISGITYGNMWPEKPSKYLGDNNK